MPVLHPGPLSPDIGLGFKRECTLCPSFLAELDSPSSQEIADVVAIGIGSGTMRARVRLVVMLAITLGIPAAALLLRFYTVGWSNRIPSAVQNVIAGVLMSIVTTSIAVIVKVGRVGFSRRFPFIRFWLVIPE